MRIPFNKPYMTGKELTYIKKAHENGVLAGDGPFTKKCHTWLETKTGTSKALLTHSCTAALEMSAILANIEPGDEIIMPSYTFVSTANAFVLRGGVPVFVDIREDTLNIDEKLIEAAITKKTKAIIVVHYAGISCEMDTILKIANTNGLILIEDAAQGLMSEYKGRQLGSIGHLGCYSFHETKNVISGEGGALLINKSKFSDRADIIRDKGTNRKNYLKGKVDKYTWCDFGSSYLPGELISAFLYAQIEKADHILKSRMNIWNFYHRNFESLEKINLITRPFVPDTCKHNAHMYYILLNTRKQRDDFIVKAKKENIDCVFHYVPLHDSSAGVRFSRNGSSLSITEDIAARIVRLPLWIGLENKQNIVLEKLCYLLEKIK